MVPRSPPTSQASFEAALERVRRNFELYVYGYVVMPEHGSLCCSVKPLPLIAEAEHFWQERCYDFSVRNERQFVAMR